MDLEDIARQLYRNGSTTEDMVKRLMKLTGSQEMSKAILKEIIATEDIQDELVSNIAHFPVSAVEAKEASVGCRGEGDFFVHHLIADVIGETGAEVDSKQQDDGGVVKLPSGSDQHLVIAVDGMHSRLSHFPFLGGFHAARASLRDVVVMGARPLAMLSDVHIGNNGDVGKILDYTAGINTVGKALGIPLVSGSTLRIGGDMVTGERITGCVGAVGLASVIKPRKHASPGHDILLTKGSGGGTISTTALFNGYHSVVKRTLNLGFLKATIPFLDHPLMKDIKCFTDVTNGGIRGDACEISRTAQVRINLDMEQFLRTIDKEVLNMLDDLDIDPLGVSTDSLLIICPSEDTVDILDYFSEQGQAPEKIGTVEKGNCVYLNTGKGQEKIVPKFREAPYTPIKKVVGTKTPMNWKELQDKLSKAANASKEKQEKMLEWLEEQ